MLARQVLAGLSFVAVIAAAEVGQAQYVDGTTLPNHISAGARDAALLEFYGQWKSVYLAQGCGEGRCYVDFAAGLSATEGGSAEQTLTVSEAHGYGMLVTVMMAPFDADAHRVFDGMVAYLRDHPADIDPALLAWNQVKGCGNAVETNGGATATDGDLDVAYALLLADEAWGSAGAIDYRDEALRTIAAILEHEVSDDGDFLLLGDWAGVSEDPTYRNATRSSDFMVSHLRAFADATGDSRWLAVRDRTYAIIEKVRSDFSPKTGLMPDFILDAAEDPRPAYPNFLESPHDGSYNWNACRYPWRIALDYLLYGDKRAKAALAPLTAWAREATGDDPWRFRASIQLDGEPTKDSYDGPLAYVAPLGPAAMIGAADQDWLNAIWDVVVEQPIGNDDYYGNTLKLLTMIVMSGHWIAP